MIKLSEQMQAQFELMCATGKLFRSSVTGDQIFSMYLQSFSPENDPIFRDPNSTTHNCNLCNNFIRRYGNIIAISPDLEIMSLFDFEPIEDEYKEPFRVLAAYLKDKNVVSIFVETFESLNSLPYESCSKSNNVFRLGIAKNVKRYTKEEAEKYKEARISSSSTYTFHHFHLNVPKQFVDMSGKSIESIEADFRESKEVFKRAMKEISLDTLILVRDLINQGSLLNGEAHINKIQSIIILKKAYDNINESKKDLWCWTASHKNIYARFKNELIGVLCSDLSQGMELNKACLDWNKRVDPANYMKAKSPITKRQIEEARKFVEENGYVDSFNRRFATMSDIQLSEILHINNPTEIKNVSIFDGVKSTNTQHKKSEFNNIDEIHIDKFMSDILPNCTSVEAFLLNSHENNMVSLTTYNIKESKPIFKWSNNYSWTYNGNLAGKSEIKENVKVAGGNVNGVLRFSILWNESSFDNSDLDAWCKGPGNEVIGYSTNFRKDRGNNFSPSGGQLDIDITHPGGKIAVENIYFVSKSKLHNGNYLFYVNPYAARNSQGFKAEIEFDGQIFSYEYNHPVSSVVNVAVVSFSDGIFSITHNLPEINSSKEIYGLQTGMFHKVTLVCKSPNHWHPNNVGNKHYFFMLQNCKCPISLRSFHAENLIPELAQHRKVLEILGDTTRIEPTDAQLSGLGFNATVRSELIVRLQGSFKRVMKIHF